MNIYSCCLMLVNKAYRFEFDLEYLFQAWENGFFIKPKELGEKILFVSPKTYYIKIDFDKNIVRIMYSTKMNEKHISYSGYVDIVDYGKEWALTKEELENE